MSGSTQDPLVVFTPSGKRGRFPRGTTVLAAARALGVDLDSVCGGRAICTRCQVQVVEGELAKHGIVSRAASVSAEGPAESRLRRRLGIAAGRRLGCQACVQADVAIDVPPDSQVHHPVVRKPFEAHDIELNPVLRAYLVEVAQPDMHDPSGDLERLLAALRAEWQLEGLSIALPALQSLQPALRAGGWRVTVAVRDGREIAAVWPGFRDRLYGAAVDVGSTTIAVHLCELGSGEVVGSAGRMNPQIRFGEDLMSRVSYVMMNPGGEAELTRAVREAIGELVAAAAKQAGIEAADVLEVTLVGNPVMHHLALGLNPVELGTAPFALATDEAVAVPAPQLGLGIHPGGRVYALPCIAGHVGADAAAVLLAEAPWERDEVSLIVDVGTNAEIVLGNRRRLLAASSPTGPAFEGAQVSGGQRAAPGAIERVRIDRGTLEPRFKVIGSELWSDDPAFASQLPAAGVTGICGSGIIEAIAEMYLAGLLLPDGTIPGSMAARSPRVVAEDRTFAYVLHAGTPELRIRQNDVRAIQLAKAALYAGAKLLMDRFGVQKVDRIRLAGAFGSHIDVQYAMTLGMIPDCALAAVSSAGNAAGTGARIALLDAASRPLIEQRVRQVEKVETAIEPDFQRHFVAAMGIPHGVDPFPELAKTVTLPRPAAGAPEAGRRRARRRP
ncbi:MAG TPA: ASKHA domain-containing protein [Steroidobacteraceae bacterium]|nr:ASKHA domain-containing protein [Steroidobacteraceae bacterium]